ncbi:MAG: TIGR04211 family SH3 domain-containing protein, partial [Magnetococcales bacterium]|nr:TIGR04211 family SH3 domain-containing protein [Magnetococcales bacterium]
VLLGGGSRGGSGFPNETGAVGWVLKRFLSDTPPARQLLSAAEEAKSKAVAERDRLTRELGEARERIKGLEAEQKELLRIKEVSTKAVELEKSHRLMLERVRSLEVDVGRLGGENEELKRHADYQYLLSGAGVLLFGLLTGSVLARRRRSSSMGSLG